MTDAHLILLLQLIKNNGSIDSLVNLGLEYSQIANLIMQVKEEGYIALKDGILTITNAGIEKLDLLNKKLNRKFSESWISPYEQYRIKQIAKSEVYIPNKRRLRI